jgi:excisionase family DNA binding protein
MIPELITPKELAGRLKVSQQAISAWVKNKKIPFTRLGGCVRFEPDAINEWIKEGRMTEGKTRKARGPRKRKPPTDRKTGAVT